MRKSRGSREREDRGKVRFRKVLFARFAVTNCPPLPYRVRSPRHRGCRLAPASRFHSAQGKARLAPRVRHVGDDDGTYRLHGCDRRRSEAGENHFAFICRQSAFFTFRGAQAASAPSKKPVAAQVTPSFVVSSELRKL